jgi:hypothetical protein
MIFSPPVFPVRPVVNWEIIFLDLYINKIIFFCFPLLPFAVCLLIACEAFGLLIYDRLVAATFSSM